MGSGYLSPTPHLANCRAAKAGVLALTKIAALDLADTGIRANCVSPAANTRMTETHGIHIRSDADDAASLVLYRLSDLSTQVTGQIFGSAGDRIAGWSDPFENHILRRLGGWTPHELASRFLPWCTTMRSTASWPGGHGHHRLRRQVPAAVPVH